MPRVKVTMEAEIKGLKGYWPDSPPGVTSQNVHSLLLNLKLKLLDHELDAHAAPNMPPALKAAYLRALREDRTLVEQLLASVKIEVVP